MILAVSVCVKDIDLQIFQIANALIGMIFELNFFFINRRKQYIGSKILEKCVLFSCLGVRERIFRMIGATRSFKNLFLLLL